MDDIIISSKSNVCSNCDYFNTVNLCCFDNKPTLPSSGCHVKLYEMVPICETDDCKFCPYLLNPCKGDRNNPIPKLNVNPHSGQKRLLESKARHVGGNAGRQSGKTEVAPYWILQEMLKHGSGDYLVISSAFPLMDKKLIPTYLKFFKDYLHLSTKDDFKEAKKKLFVHGTDFEATIFFGSATNANSLESSTALAAHLDEVGQDDFTVDAYDAILGRLTRSRGRILYTTCYDDKTEIYTDSGWKLIGELTDTDKVYAPNKQGVGKFEHPYSRTWEPYDGKMFYFKGGRIDLCVTPNHRMLFKNGKQFFIKDARHFSKLSHRYITIPKLIHPIIRNKTYFTLPAITMGTRWGNTRYCPPVKILMADWCAFMGWFLSEGSITGCKGGVIVNGMYRVYCSQTNPEKREKREKLKKDLEKLPFKWSYDGNSYVTSNKQLWSYLKTFGNCYQKYIPQDLKYAGKDNLLILIERMISGDGSRIKSGFRYYTTSKQLAQDFREICMLVGISTGIKEHESQSFQGTNGNYHPIFHIWERRRKSGIVTQWKEIDYTGNIGCVGTSTGLVLVRRNGEECISGNTLYNHSWYKREVFDRWKSGDPEYEVINWDSVVCPGFSKAEWEDRKKKMPTWKFNMQYRGIYDLPAGMIYNIFKDYVGEGGHLVKPFTIPQSWDWNLAIDPGGVHTASGWFAHSPEGKRYLVRSYLDGNMNTKEHVAKAKRFSEFGRISRAVGGSGSEGQFRSDWTAAGIHVREPEIRDVESGIDKVASLLKEGQFFIFDVPENQWIIEQFLTYSRELNERGDPTERIAHKSEYHGMDMVRYWAVGIDNTGDYSTPYEFQRRNIPKYIIDESPIFSGGGINRKVPQWR